MYTEIISALLFTVIGTLTVVVNFGAERLSQAGQPGQLLYSFLISFNTLNVLYAFFVGRWWFTRSSIPDVRIVCQVYITMVFLLIAIICFIFRAGL